MYELQNVSPAFVKKNDGGFLIISSHICHAQFSQKEVFFEATSICICIWQLNIEWLDWMVYLYECEPTGGKCHQGGNLNIQSQSQRRHTALFLFNVLRFNVLCFHYFLHYDRSHRWNISQKIFQLRGTERDTKVSV